MVTSSLPARWIDPLVMGDIKAGAETLPDLDADGEMAVALVVFAAIPASQEAPFYHTSIEGLRLDDEAFGDWVFQARLTPALRRPDPAQSLVLVRDGRALQAVVDALDAHLGRDPIDAARRAASALMARHARAAGYARWSWRTPLGRSVALEARRLG